MTTMKRNTDSIQPHELWEVTDYSEIMDINLKSRARDRRVSDKAPAETPEAPETPL